MIFFEAFAFTKLANLTAVGNPANVVVFDHNEEMDVEAMSHISSVRFGLFLITVFLKQRANGNEFDLKYYTQYGQEWTSFCGHGAICAAGVVKKFYNPAASEVVFHLSGNRVIKAHVNEDSATLTLPLSVTNIFDVDSAREKICEILQIKNVSIEVIYKSQMNDYVVYLNKNESIRKITPNLELLASYASALDYRVMIVVQKSDFDDIDIEVRAFSHLALNKKDDNGEDVACGSANCSIASIMKIDSYKVLFPYQYKITGQFGGLQSVDCDRLANIINLTGGFKVEKY